MAILFYVFCIFLLILHFTLLRLFWSYILNEIILEFIIFFFSGVYLSLHLVVDLFSLIFTSFILLISSVVVFYSWFYIYKDLCIIRFLVIVLIFVASIVVLVFSSSILGIIFGWDGLGVTSFLLVIFYNNVSSLRSGIVTIYTNRLGDIFLVFSFYYFFSFGWFIYDFYYFYCRVFMSLLLLLSGITKRAQLPFSSWLPAAISAPTPVSSLVHSSTLVTAGVYLFIRFFYIIDFVLMTFYFILISLTTSFSSGMMAFLENDLKKLVAMSTLSQLGLIIFCISTGQLIFSFFHMVTHALFKSLLFLSCGFLILTALGNQDMRFMGNKFIIRKSIFIMLVVSILRLCGFPFLAGFFSKDLIIGLCASLNMSLCFYLFFLVSCIFSLFYSLNVFFFVGISIFIGFRSSFRILNTIKLFLIGVLFFWSIFFGKLFIFVFLDGEFYINSFYTKILGIIIFFLLFFYRLFRSIYGLFFLNFLFNIINLNWFFGGAFTKNVESLDFIMLGEIYWLELIGYLSLNNLFLIIRGFLLAYFKIIVVSLILCVFFFFIFLILLLISLFKSAVLKFQRIKVKQNFFLRFVLP